MRTVELIVILRDVEVSQKAPRSERDIGNNYIFCSLPQRNLPYGLDEP